jgi:hypothetical protein
VAQRPRRKAKDQRRLGGTLMTRLCWPVFEPRYPATLAGLLAAEAELVRLTALHLAYATQPNVTPVWQGYIDQRSGAVERQRLIVERLTRARLDPDQWLRQRLATMRTGEGDV